MRTASKQQRHNVPAHTIRRYYHDFLKVLKERVTIPPPLQDLVGENDSSFSPVASPVTPVQQAKIEAPVVPVEMKAEVTGVLTISKKRTSTSGTPPAPMYFPSSKERRTRVQPCRAAC